MMIFQKNDDFPKNDINVSEPSEQLSKFFGRQNICWQLFIALNTNVPICIH